MKRPPRSISIAEARVFFIIMHFMCKEPFGGSIFVFCHRVEVTKEEVSTVPTTPFGFQEIQIIQGGIKYNVYVPVLDGHFRVCWELVEEVSDMIGGVIHPIVLLHCKQVKCHENGVVNVARIS